MSCHFSQQQNSSKWSRSSVLVTAWNVVWKKKNKKTICMQRNLLKQKYISCLLHKKKERKAWFFYLSLRVSVSDNTTKLNNYYFYLFFMMSLTICECNHNMPWLASYVIRKLIFYREGHNVWHDLQTQYNLLEVTV